MRSDAKTATSRHPRPAGEPWRLAVAGAMVARGPGDLASGLLAVPAWAIGLLGLLVVGVVVAVLLVGRRRPRRP